MISRWSAPPEQRWSTSAERRGVLMSGAQHVSLGVEGAVLHGQESQVRFSIGGREPWQCELADLLVLGLGVVDGALRSLRACFIQAKRGKSATKTSGARFDIKEDQLALLRSFPEFEGVVGVYKGIKCKFRNRSGMLGAYGLLSAPGEFTVLSARLLGQILGGRKTLTEKELTPAIVAESASYRSKSRGERSGWFPWDLDPEHCPACREMWRHFVPFPWHDFRDHHRHFGPHVGHGNAGLAGTDGSVLSCLSIDEFVDAWSSLRLGEPWSSGVASENSRGMFAAIASAVSRMAAAADGLKHTLDLLTTAARNEDVALELPNEAPEGRMAVIAATVSVTRGEGEKPVEG